jgi:hypothetical protein
MSKTGDKEGGHLHFVKRNGEKAVPTVGWNWLARELAADQDHKFPGCRWALALGKDGTVCKVYEGRGATAISGQDSGALRLRGCEAVAFIQNVNQRLGHTEEDVLAILANSSPRS